MTEEPRCRCEEDFEDVDEGCSVHGVDYGLGKGMGIPEDWEFEWCSECEEMGLAPTAKEDCAEHNI